MDQISSNFFVVHGMGCSYSPTFPIAADLLQRYLWLTVTS